ncbi:proline racemase family protein [Limosilactobacillus sp.]|jgi:proline racemase|uniref:proline racemase family protein n=1 Tax=Limosilactobacillus sp. TaxID=2773925 RepID=UPI0025BBFF6C|nr:proline racemase family protein [Limosilactobacillus sp.]MCH3921433.1 proline racemase family protein [Limosilactobacillus sp.]MCH3928204.1 proline racemase family protein [Limosilactobacillus sp.]
MVKAKRTLEAVETHSGEPMRVVTGGLPDIPGDSVYEKTKWLAKHDDQIRKLMLREPRGYAPLCCNLIVPSKKAAAGFIVMEQTEYPMMSGGNVISVATALLETGKIPMQEPVTKFDLESPAGLIGITAECHDGKVTQVTFKNVPAFAVYLDEEIDVPHLGKVKVDVAWGGMFYVIADIRQFQKRGMDIELKPEYGRQIAKVLALVLGAAQEQLPVSHPDYPGVGITIAELSGPTDNPNADWKNEVLVANGKIDFDDPATWTGSLDRCPCGTGTCAKMAALYAKGELKLNEPFRHENALGIVYTGKLTGTAKIGDHVAVIPTVGGESWITGFSKWILDESDPFTNGYTMGDIWSSEVMEDDANTDVKH